MPLDEVHESNARFQDAWRLFARGSAAGEVRELPEVSIAACHVSWAMMNAAFPRGRVDTAEELERCAAAAARHLAPRGHGWMLALCEDWMPVRLCERATALLAPHGLKPSLVATGMVAERLGPSTWPPPTLEVRETRDGRGRRALADINARCYELPLAVGREAFDVPGLFQGEGRGFVGYRREEPATCAGVFRVEDVAYISMVATLPSHRRLGCAEAVMRRALAEAWRDWGLERTVLHASPEGLPMYRSMGYQPVTRFHLYMAEPRVTAGP